MRLVLAAIGLLWATLAQAGTIYIDTLANGSADATFSGSTDTTTIKVGTGAGTATVTCSATTYTGGLPGCSFSGTPNLSSVIVTPGPTQDSVYIGCGTGGTSQKIFWILAVDDANDLIETATTSQAAAAPTGCTAATSVWNIGGRHLLTSATVEGALRAGDTAIFNTSPASTTATPAWTFRLAGDSVTGYATIMGKVGVRPVLATANSGVTTVSTAALALVRVSNLEIQQTHASNGVALTVTGVGDLIDNVKVSDAGTLGITSSSTDFFTNVEVTGTGGDCFNSTNTSQILTGMYLHDCGGDGVEITSSSPTITIRNSVIDSNVGRGIYFSGAATVSTANNISNTTVYGNGDSGLETVDVDTAVRIQNSIFTENGNAAGEYNVEMFAPGTIELNGYHAYNTFWCTGLNANACTSTAGNVLGLTANFFVAASELLVNPLMSNPGSGNFTLPSTSPAAGTGFPGQLLGATGLGYMSMGAEQLQAGGGGGQGMIGAGF